jgi:hypothetical protein
MEITPRIEKIEERKNRAVEALSSQFARNALPLEEYERLVEYISRAESERELDIIEKIVDETAFYAGLGPERARTSVHSQTRPEGPPWDYAPGNEPPRTGRLGTYLRDQMDRLEDYLDPRGESPEEYRERERTPDGRRHRRPDPPVNFTILSSRTIGADALLRDDSTLVTILGDSRIIINENELPPGQTVVDAVTILGETIITVPPGLAVTVKALPVAGSVFIGKGVETQRLPGGSELVITGAVLLGNITVKLRKEKRRR